MDLPGGLVMADRMEDRDGLRLEGLHLALGPLLPHWPAGAAAGRRAVRRRAHPRRGRAARPAAGAARADRPGRPGRAGAAAGGGRLVRRRAARPPGPSSTAAPRPPTSCAAASRARLLRWSLRGLPGPGRRRPGRPPRPAARGRPAATASCRRSTTSALARDVVGLDVGTAALVVAAHAPLLPRWRHVPDLLLAPVALLLLGRAGGAVGRRRPRPGRPHRRSPAVAGRGQPAGPTSPGCSSSGGAPPPHRTRCCGGPAAAGLLVVAALMLAVVPVGDRVVADLPVGIVWFNAMDVLLWAFVLAGRLVGRGGRDGAGRRLPVPGAGAGVRAAADVRAHRARGRRGQPGRARRGRRRRPTAGTSSRCRVAFGVFLLCVAAFSLWGPFAAPAGGDLAGGVLAETVGRRPAAAAGRPARAARRPARRSACRCSSAAAPVRCCPTPAWQLVKTLAVLLLLVVVRRRLPVLRPERFAEVGWVVLCR